MINQQIFITDPLVINIKKQSINSSTQKMHHTVEKEQNWVPKVNNKMTGKQEKIL